jgi:TonB family protein
MTALHKSLLISAGLHILIFMSFWVSPKQNVTEYTPLRLDLIELDTTAKDSSTRPSRPIKRQGNYTKPSSKPKAVKKLTLSDLAPKWDGPIIKKDINESYSDPSGRMDPGQDGDGGGSALAVLNSPEFVYSSYFQRIHDKLDYYWQSKIRHEVFKKQAQGQWNYYLSRITKTRVILDAQGNLKKLIILTPSGEQELDSSALAAFQQASPFPNPPKELIKNGEVSIEWHFILEIYD